jgi:hypothetical protein
VDYKKTQITVLIKTNKKKYCKSIKQKNAKTRKTIFFYKNTKKQNKKENKNLESINQMQVSES